MRLFSILNVIILRSDFTVKWDVYFFPKKKKKGHAEFPKQYFPEEKYAAENFSKAQLENPLLFSKLLGFALKCDIFIISETKIT